MVIYKIKAVTDKRRKGLARKTGSKEILAFFGIFQGLSALSKLASKLSCSENFPGCTLRHLSQAYVCMPIQGIFFHFAAPLGPSEKKDRDLEGRMLAPRLLTCWVAWEPLPPQNGEHETLSVYNRWSFTALRWKGKIHIFIQSLLGNCNFRVVLFSSHILAKKVKNWLPYAACQYFMLQNHRMIQERISGCHLVQCPAQSKQQKVPWVSLYSLSFRKSVLLCLWEFKNFQTSFKMKPINLS